NPRESSLLILEALEELQSKCRKIRKSSNNSAGMDIVANLVEELENIVIQLATDRKESEKSLRKKESELQRLKSELRTAKKSAQKTHHSPITHHSFSGLKSKMTFDTSPQRSSRTLNTSRSSSPNKNMFKSKIKKNWRDQEDFLTTPLSLDRSSNAGSRASSLVSTNSRISHNISRSNEHFGGNYKLTRSLSSSNHSRNSSRHSQAPKLNTNPKRNSKTQPREHQENRGRQLKDRHQSVSTSSRNNGVKKKIQERDDIDSRLESLRRLLSDVQS
ncbi:hypothetical protein HK096_002516, partial [Nowakowskiella sp. JEL0078]